MARPSKLKQPKREEEDDGFKATRTASPRAKHTDETIIRVKMLGMQGKSPAEIGRLLHVNTTTVSRFLGRTTDPRRSAERQVIDTANHAAWKETARARLAAGEVVDVQAVGPAPPVASGSMSVFTPKRERDAEDDEVGTVARTMSNGTVKKLRFDDSAKGKAVEKCKRGSLQPFIAIPQSRNRRSSSGSASSPASATVSPATARARAPAAAPSPSPRGSRGVILPPVMPSSLAGPSRTSRAAAAAAQSPAVAGPAPKEPNAVAPAPPLGGPFSTSKVPAAYKSSFGAASTSGSLPAAYTDSFGYQAVAGPSEPSDGLTAAILAALPPEPPDASSSLLPLVHLDHELPLSTTSAPAPEPEPTPSEPAPSTVSSLLSSLGSPFTLLLPFFIAAGCSTALELADLGKLPREGLEEAVEDVVGFAKAPLSEGERGRLTAALIQGKEVAEQMAVG